MTFFKELEKNQNSSEYTKGPEEPKQSGAKATKLETPQHLMISRYTRSL